MPSLSLYEKSILMAKAVEEACSTFNVKLPPIQWSNRMTASAGRASKKKITFSIPLLHKAPTDFCIETAVHEVAHYIDFQQRGTSDHGNDWRAIMATLGYKNPDRCHQLNRDHLYRYEVRCSKCHRGLIKYTRFPTRTLRNKQSRCCSANLYVVNL